MYCNLSRNRVEGGGRIRRRCGRSCSSRRCRGSSRARNPLLPLLFIHGEFEDGGGRFEGREVVVDGRRSSDVGDGLCKVILRSQDPYPSHPSVLEKRGLHTSCERSYVNITISSSHSNILSQREITTSLLDPN